MPATAADPTTRSTVYEVITDHIIRQLEAGVVPWRKPWSARTDMPRSIHGRPYRGINVFLTLLRGYSDPRWLTFKQAQERGGRVRKGEKGTPLVLWKTTTVREQDPDTGETREKQVPFARYFTVFNVEQCDGLNVEPWRPAPAEVPATVIETAQAIIDGMPNAPELRYDGGDRAYYVPATDVIHLPRRSTFRTQEEFYSTAFHEMGHSTGHRSRCNRAGVAEFDHFGSDRYGREELVAEMTAAFLCGEADIAPATIGNNAAYIGSWLRSLREDSRAVVIAAAQAQKAADYILNRQQASEEPVAAAA